MTLYNVASEITQPHLHCIKMITRESQLHSDSKGNLDPTFPWEEWWVSRRACYMGRDSCSHPQNMQSSQAKKLPYYLKEDRGSQTLERGDSYFCTKDVSYETQSLIDRCPLEKKAWQNYQHHPILLQRSGLNWPWDGGTLEKDPKL